jgi:hypothetical protein
MIRIMQSADGEWQGVGERLYDERQRSAGQTEQAALQRVQHDEKHVASALSS